MSPEIERAVQDVKKLRDAIRRLHGLESTHLRREPVREVFQGETVWEGDVEVFEVYGHSKARLAYGWSHETDAGGRNYVAVLGVDPIKSATDAVRAAVVTRRTK